MRFRDRNIDELRSIAEELVASFPEDKNPWERHPVHQLGHNALTDLITYVEQERIVEREQAIRNAAQSAVELWETRRNIATDRRSTGEVSMAWMGHNLPTAIYHGQPRPTSEVTAHTLTIHLPPWLTHDIALWLAEVQIRQQVEEIEAE